MKFQAYEELEQLTPGVLLLSEPFIDDENFGRSVVLISEVNETGCVGFVLNKPVLEMTIESILDEAGLDGSSIFLGGPVEQDLLHFIYRSKKPFPNSIPIVGDLYLGGDIELLKLALEVEDINPDDVRFFVGYSGWGDGQLEEELGEGSWIVTKIDSGKIMDLAPEDLWRSILKIMGGKYQMMSNYPLDPRLN